MSARITALLFGAALAFIGTAAAAQDGFSANSVLPGCRSLIEDKPIDPLNRGLCMGLVQGTAQMGNAVLVTLPSNSNNDKLDPYLRNFRALLCIDVPNGMTNRQMVQVVVSYLEARPTRMHEEFGDLALEALQAAWPCR
jgi:hypothetical protein